MYIPPIFQKFPAFGFLTKNRYLCAVLQEDTAVAQAKQAGGRKTMQKGGRRHGNKA